MFLEHFDATIWFEHLVSMALKLKKQSENGENDLCRKLTTENSQRTKGQVPEGNDI